MSRQFPRDAALSAPAPARPAHRTGGMRRPRLVAAGASAALAAALLIGWNPPTSAAQQSPDTWSGDRSAVLPSGLTVHIDFSAAPGFDVAAEPGELAERFGGGRAAALYTDGLRPGDPAQTFRITDNRPQTDGSWRTVGTLGIAFSRPVRNPRLHVSGLSAVATGKGGATSTVSRLSLTGGSPGAPALVNRTDWPGWTVDGNSLAPAGAGAAADAGSAAEGSLELAGTFRTAVFRVEQRSTARAGSTAAPAPAPLLQAYTVTLDEGVGTAPQGYDNASHLLSDLFLGADAGGAARLGRRAATTGTTPLVPPATPAGGRDAAGEPLVQLDHGAGRRSVFSSPAPPRLQPGRGEYQGGDPAVGYPAEAAIGRYYRVTVPVAVGGAPATLAGWVDFDRNGRFDPAERVQTEVPATADSATLEWTVPANASSGETWARLRIGRDAAQLVSAGGFADSGQVSDQRIRLTVGAARPEIATPVDGTVVADARPQVRGEGAVAGATVEVRDGDAVVCKTRVEKGGDWSCRPSGPLTAGAHTLTPVETTSGGLVLRGDPVRVTVKTAPPTAPVLTLPEYTNDPGLQLTGTGEPGSTVSVTDRPAGARGGAGAGAGGELCSTAVRSDGGWSCLPVENLPDGRHQLTPNAVDAAGNRTPGQVFTLVVDTVPPDRPVLTTPAAGETVRVARPKLGGRAEPGARVIVTARAGSSASAERIVACGATAAVDGSWTCAANRDLTDGEQWLVVTATDLAGNGTAADAVTVRVAAAVPPAPGTPSPAPSPSVASPSPSAPASTPAAASTVPAVPVPGAPSPSAPSPSVPAPSVPLASGPAVAVPSPVVPSSAPAVVAPSASAAAPAPAAAPTPPGPAVSPSADRPTATAPAVPVPTVSPSVPAPPSPSVPTALSVPAAPTAPAAEPVLEPVLPGLLPIVVPPAAGTVPPASASASASPGAGPAPSPSAGASASGATGTATPAAPAVSTSPAASTTPATSAVPSTAPTAAVPTAAATATPTAGVAPAVPAGQVSPETSRALAAPPAEQSAEPSPGSGATQAQPASDHSRSEGWRAGLAGLLLLLTGVGLITRRVFARGPGARRR
ncbi:Ig-like domain-containing protein [Kitasatospora sp. NPDC001603]|uniref:Ig-like domain-containing protein n=1 Tax=Kitasatospora sp. NPDC001603 TaxID=3154388 RepID=UPI0033284371